jgi:hypothetical protein
MLRRVLALVSLALAVTLAARAQQEPVDASDEATAAGGLPLARVIPAAASTAGAGGSYFKTSVQLFNPYGVTVTGRFVFHPAGTPGTAADPSMDVAIEPLETASYPDVMEAMGITGLGTLDLLVPSPSNSPVVVARVYDDAGLDGTSGFTQEAVSPNDNGPGGSVLASGTGGHLILPADTDAFRYNIGIRTLSTSASIQFTVRDAAGAFIRTSSKLLGPNSFVQSEASQMLGVALPAGGVVRVSLSGGSAIVYGATIDNVTQDSSIQFARSGF